MKHFWNWELLEEWANRMQRNGVLTPGSDFSVLYEQTPTSALYLCFDGRVNHSCFK